jgi:hypothetical protein
MFCFKSVTLATIFSLSLTIFSLQAKEYIAQTGDEKITCSIVELERTQVEEMCNKMLTDWSLAKEIILPSWNLSHKIKFPENIIPLSIKITNNSPRDIYLPGNQYLGTDRVKLYELYSNSSIAQYVISSIPVVICGIMTAIFSNLLKKEFKGKYFLSYLPLLAGAVGSTKEMIRTKDLFQKLESFTPLCKGDPGKLKPGEVFEDTLLIDANIIDEDFFEKLKLIYKKEKAWDPREMTTVPNDGYAYYFDKAILDVSDLKKDIVVEGMVIFKNPETKIFLGENAMYLNGITLLEKDCSIILESGTLIADFSEDFWSALQ